MFDFETTAGTAGADEYLRLVSHDAFSYGALNKSAALIYWCLMHEPLTPTELTARTGRSRATVHRALQRMARIVDGKSGEILALVVKVGVRWTVNRATDLGRIALVLGSAGRARRRQAQFERDRKQYRRFLRERKHPQHVARSLGPHCPLACSNGDGASRPDDFENNRPATPNTPRKTCA